MTRGGIKHIVFVILLVLLGLRVMMQLSGKERFFSVVSVEMRIYERIIGQQVQQLC